jgi:hypothetical protein
MKTIVTEFQFIEAFRHAGRETQFSVNARRALFAHLEAFEEDTGTEITLDPIGICCEFAEYPSAISASKEYGQNFETESEALDWLREQTQVIEFDGGLVIQLF